MIPVLYEDEDVLAVDKPEGMAVIPERKREQPSLLAQLTAVHPPRVFVVHRLDKEVSGVVLFAKHPAAHRHMNLQFSERRVWKGYILVVHGLMEREEGIITIPLREYGSGRVAADSVRGRPCITEYWLREKIGAYSVVMASPKTGRRHQIRAHFYSIGHPVVGDLRYGDRPIQAGFPRLLLHARRLELELPTGTQAVIESPVPDSFLAALDGLRAVLRTA
jgi:RluA family pseudouridine synthase